MNLKKYAAIFSTSGGQKKESSISLEFLRWSRNTSHILDEPVAGMDAPGKKILFDLLHHLNEGERSTLYVLVSHNMDDVASIMQTEFW